MEHTIKIQNLKCGGCAHTITTKLGELKGIEDIIVNNETNEVNFKYSEVKDISLVKKTLSKLGYPAEDESNSVSKKAKSFVSCAVGRLNS
ncbi:heavy-metal-associated domain-containing protein [Psychroserpens sp. XS_ASV72]|uniref:heavy-metal-associated domain-containing protein n=1 Tax=Psychroserpens sp. XS_ASV72 TaxID=3241293 RepID=UPI003516FF39